MQGVPLKEERLLDYSVMVTSMRRYSNCKRFRMVLCMALCMACFSLKTESYMGGGSMTASVLKQNCPWCFSSITNRVRGRCNACNQFKTESCMVRGIAHYTQVVSRVFISSVVGPFFLKR